jgi:hypothetical protein
VVGEHKLNSAANEEMRQNEQCLAIQVYKAASVRTCIIQVNESLTMVACLLHEDMDGKKLALYRRIAV